MEQINKEKIDEDIADMIFDDDYDDDSKIPYEIPKGKYSVKAVLCA